ncbi:MAG: PIG-L family deacetylase [Thermomicrobiales bacterium]
MTAIFLAPHYDDVALSCGGTVAALAEATRRDPSADPAVASSPAPLVVTVFGGTPGGESLTAFARWQHERWGTDGHDTVAVRIDEERTAATILGCAVRTLPYLDAIYRGDQYLSDEALFGPILPGDAQLVAQLTAAIAALPALSALYVPLAIGNHVDHQIVYQVGQILAARGLRVLGYEDFPYAILGDERERRLAAIRAALGEPELVPIAATLPRRIAAIAAYRTQLPTIFRFTDDWPGAVMAWAGEIGGDHGAAERFWPLLGQNGS